MYYDTENEEKGSVFALPFLSCLLGIVLLLFSLMPVHELIRLKGTIDQKPTHVHRGEYCWYEFSLNEYPNTKFRKDDLFYPARIKRLESLERADSVIIYMESIVKLSGSMEVDMMYTSKGGIFTLEDRKQKRKKTKRVAYILIALSFISLINIWQFEEKKAEKINTIILIVLTALWLILSGIDYYSG